MKDKVTIALENEKLPKVVVIAFRGLCRDCMLDIGVNSKVLIRGVKSILFYFQKFEQKDPYMGAQLTEMLREKIKSDNKVAQRMHIALSSVQQLLYNFNGKYKDDAYKAIKIATPILESRLKELNSRPAKSQENLSPLVVNNICSERPQEQPSLEQDGHRDKRICPSKEN